MASLVSKEAQQIRATDVIIYERDVWTVEGDDWTDDGLRVRLTIALLVLTSIKRLKSLALALFKC